MGNIVFVIAIMAANEKNGHLVQLMIDEADLVVDYFRCASRVNPLSAVANYKQYQQLKEPIDKRTLFIAQQFLLLNSHEDCAQFLHALHRRAEKGTTIQWTLSDDSDNLAHYPKILQKFQKPDELLTWLGIDHGKLVKAARKRSGLSQRKATKLINDRIQDMMDGLDVCRRQKSQRHRPYNATKHGKPILSIRPELLYKVESGSESDGPHFFYQKKQNDGSNQLRSDSIPFSDQQFDSLTRAIIQISEVIRDLIYFFVSQNYPDRLGHLQQAYDNLCSFRSEVPDLFSDTKLTPQKAS